MRRPSFFATPSRISIDIGFVAAKKCCKENKTKKGLFCQKFAEVWVQFKPRINVIWIGLKGEYDSLTIKDQFQENMDRIKPRLGWIRQLRRKLKFDTKA